MTSGGLPVPGRGRTPDHRPESTNLADILERVLDKGIVIAGDIRVNLLDIELLTIKIRLLICSIDKAEQIGLNWWRHDPFLTGRAGGDETNRSLDGAGESEVRPAALAERASGELVAAVSESRDGESTAATPRSRGNGKEEERRPAG